MHDLSVYRLSSEEMVGNECIRKSLSVIPTAFVKYAFRLVGGYR